MRQRGAEGRDSSSHAPGLRVVTTQAGAPFVGSWPLAMQQMLQCLPAVCFRFRRTWTNVDKIGGGLVPPRVAAYMRKNINIVYLYYLVDALSLFRVA